MSDTYEPIPLALLKEQHLRTAVQALAYLVAFNSVTKQESVFDAEREAALAVIRDNAPAIVLACNSFDALTASNAALSASNAALREAMRKIQSKCEPDWSIDDEQRVDDIAVIAERALASQTPRKGASL